MVLFAIYLRVKIATPKAFYVNTLKVMNAEKKLERVFENACTRAPILLHKVICVIDGEAHNKRKVKHVSI